jgi:signal transduction histidine kinase
MKRTGWIAAVSIVLAWLTLGIWQRNEFVHQRDLIRGALAGQADSIVNALISGIRSHRWIGPFFQTQLPGTLEQLAESDSVLAVAIVPDHQSGEAAKAFVAGDPSLLALSDREGSSWRTQGYTLIRSFELDLAPDPLQDPSGRDARGQGHRGQGDRGQGHGRPGQESWPPWLADADGSVGREFKAMLVLDRTLTDAQVRRSGLNRLLLVLSGGLLIGLIAVSWRVTVRLAESRGQTKVLQAQTRHLAELGHAAAGLAHETRNPLGLIRGWTQRLSEAGLPTLQQRQQANAIVEECDRVTSRINEFLAFARPADPQLESVPIRQMVEELKLLLESDMADRRISLDVSGVPTEASVIADAGQLRQVVFNLTQNAIGFARDGGRVAIRVIARPHRKWRLEVADDGPGPDPQSIDSLFEPYFTTRSTGTGLGLSIVRRIVLAHDWTVGYSPGLDGGAVFWVDDIRSPSSTSIV